MKAIIVFYLLSPWLVQLDGAAPSSSRAHDAPTVGGQTSADQASSTPDVILSGAPGPVESSIYSNTLGTSVFPLSDDPQAIVTDDIIGVGSSGCDLARYRFRIADMVDANGVSGPYRVDFALYRNCPGGSVAGAPANVLITGSEGFAEYVPGEGPAVRDVEFVVPGELSIDLPQSFWLGIRANRPNVGVFGGKPALRGFSADRFLAASSGCDASAGGFPKQPHASFNAEVFRQIVEEISVGPRLEMFARSTVSGWDSWGNGI